MAGYSVEAFGLRSVIGVDRFTSGEFVILQTNDGDLRLLRAAALGLDET